MQAPPSLKAGDKVAVVGTARKISQEALARAKALLAEWGLEVVLGSNLFQEDHQFAGTDTQRSSDLQWGLDDSSIKAVLCARGGYGTVRLLEKLDWSGFEKNPKWICGYSDVTALHSNIHKLGFQTLHSTMPINFESNTPDALTSLRAGLFDEIIQHECDNHALNQKGIGQGELVGGNLSMLYSLRGTPYDLDTDDKILFIEDLDEYLYHIDRMMMNLKVGRMLDRLAGLLVGGMTDMNDNDTPYGKSAQEIVKEHTEGFDYPIAFGFPAGHIDDNRALILGRKAKLEVSSTTRLTFP